MMVVLVVTVLFLTRLNEDKLRGLESCEALVRSVLTFGMDHINTLKFKELFYSYPPCTLFDQTTNHTEQTPTCLPAWSFQVVQVS